MTNVSGRMLRALAFLQGFNGRRNPHLDFSLGLKRSVSNLVYAVAISFTSGARTVLGRGFFYNRCFNCDRSFYKFFFCFFPIAVRHSVLVAFVGCTGLFFRVLHPFVFLLLVSWSSVSQVPVAFWCCTGLFSGSSRFSDVVKLSVLAEVWGCTGQFLGTPYSLVGKTCQGSIPRRVWRAVLD